MEALAGGDKPTKIGKLDDPSWKLKKRDSVSMKEVALYQLPWLENAQTFECYHVGN